MNPSLTSQTPSLTPQEQRMEELLDRVWNPDGEPDVEALEELAELLPAEDGVHMESPWHRAAMNLLIDLLAYYWRDRDDFYVGGNMFIYYLNRRRRQPQSKGPDFFFVAGVDRHPPRKRWACWNEGKFPHVIIELLSPTTAEQDRTVKKDVYEQDFETDEYFLYDPTNNSIEGWRLNARNKYQPIALDERGWLWSEKLQLWIGAWTGDYLGMTETWPRFYDSEGRLIPLQAEAEAARAEAEKQRADAAVAELTRLRALLAERERPNV